MLNINSKIEIKKSISQYRREMRKYIKPKVCLLCGEKKQGFCNSHTIPQLSLKKIAESGMLLQASCLMGLENLDDELGLNKSGTIQVICRKCDAFYFRDYENESNLNKNPSDKMLAQIALKNFLLELVRRREEKFHFNKIFSDEQTTRILRIKAPEISKTNLDSALQKVKDCHNSFDYDIKDFINEISLHKAAINNNSSGGYQIIFHEILPYRTPIAFQGSLTLIKDMYDYPVNNISDHSEKNRIQKLHIAVLPLQNNTKVLAFYHKKDRKYKSLKSQFNSSSRLKKIEFLNYLIFAYTENYYFAPQIKEKIITDEKLVLLSQELFGRPNLGQNLDMGYYTKVKPSEIPNFLLEDWALS